MRKLMLFNPVTASTDIEDPYLAFADFFNRAALGADWAIESSCDAAVEGNRVLLTGAGDYEDAIRYENWYTSAENSEISWYQSTTTKDATSDGPWVGFRYSQWWPGAGRSTAGRMTSNTTSSSGKAQIGIYNAVSGFGVTATAASALTFSAGDLIYCKLTRNANEITMYGSNTVNATTTTVTASFVYRDGPYLPTISKLAIWIENGITYLDDFRFRLVVTDPVSYLVIGDSISEGSSASVESARYKALIETLGGVYNDSSGYSVTEDAVNLLPEILLHQPASAFLMIGGNDIAFSIAAGTWQANYQTLVNGLVADGISITHLLPTPRDAADLTDLRDWIIATYGAGTVLDTWTPFGDPFGSANMHEDYDYDNTHPNDAGHQLIADIILDTTNPAIAIATPTADPTYETDTTPLASLAGTASDDVVVKSVTWTNNVDTGGVATGTTSWSIADINLAEGENVLTVTAWDATGHSANDAITVTYTPPAGITWLLQDEYDTNYAAGSVNGTYATDGSNQRTVIDANTVLAVDTGNLTLGIGAADGEPSIKYPAIARELGLMFICTPTIVNNTRWYFGIDADGTIGAGNFSLFYVVEGGNLVKVKDQGGAVGQTIGVFTGGSIMTNAMVLRTAGQFFFRNGELWWIGTGDNSANAWPYIASSTIALTANTVGFLRVPDTNWYPTPTASDSFSTNGALTVTDGKGHVEANAGGDVAYASGGTWANTAGVTANTPGTLGSELVSNGNMETGDPPTGWSTITGTLDGVADERTGGAGAQSMAIIRAGASNTYGHQEIAATIGQWYRINFYSKNIDAVAVTCATDQGWSWGLISAATNGATSWASRQVTVRATSATPQVRFRVLATSDGNSGRVDDASCFRLDPADLFTVVASQPTNVLAMASWTRDAAIGTQCGLVLNLDDESNPQNFVLIYLEGANIKVDQVTSGTYANLATTAYTYSAGARLAAITYINAGGDRNLRVFYNNTAIGTALTITVAGTKHGLFSTSSGNTCADWNVFARGDNGEYSILGDYTE